MRFDDFSAAAVVMVMKMMMMMWLLAPHKAAGRCHSFVSEKVVSLLSPEEGNILFSERQVKSGEIFIISFDKVTTQVCIFYLRNHTSFRSIWRQNLEEYNQMFQLVCVRIHA